MMYAPCLISGSSPPRKSERSNVAPHAPFNNSAKRFNPKDVSFAGHLPLFPGSPSIEVHITHSVCRSPQMRGLSTMLPTGILCSP